MDWVSEMILKIQENRIFPKAGVSGAILGTPTHVSGILNHYRRWYRWVRVVIHWAGGQSLCLASHFPDFFRMICSRISRVG